MTDPDDGQKWPKGLTEEDGKLYRNGKLLVPESRVLELCEAWHHHMMHPVVKKQALDMQRRFEIDQINLYTAIEKVRKNCSVCQACNPDNRNVKGEAQWTRVPDQPMESVAMDVLSMPEVHIGKGTFDCVVLCVEWASPCFVVPKKVADEWRLVVHYRGLNAQTQHDSYTLPLIEDMLQKQHRRRIFTVIDLKHGYHQMPLAEKSRACTAMSTPLGPLQWKVMPMGVTNGNAAFQRMLENLLEAGT